MYKTEKQFTRNASKLPVEEVFTSVDLDRGQEYDPKLGFNFQYPQRWVSDPSQKKAIGIRRLQVIPSSHVIELGCACGNSADNARTCLINRRSDANKSFFKYITLSITSGNTLDEIMHCIVNEFNGTIGNINYSFDYRYNYRTGELEMFMSNAAETREAYFCFEEYYGTWGFLEFLNQDNDQEGRDYINKPHQAKIFQGVWNRETLYFHTSFSNSKLHFLGLNGDHFDDPSVFYPFSTNSNDFRVWFTTDLIHPILPRHCDFLMQLCFVMNVEDYTT